MNTRFAEVIKYNPMRLYFGNWTPKLIYSTYNENRCREENRTSTLNIGILYEDAICDALWNEMSYNPERFGKESPFMFNGKNSIKKFCDYYTFWNPNDKKIMTFKRVRDELQKFLDFMQSYDPLFLETGHTTNALMEIGLEEDKDFSNIGYKILSKLIQCIHIICSQNNLDYAGIKKYNLKITDVILARHPDGIRPQKIPNYRLIGSLETEQTSLRSKMFAKEDEIASARMDISVLEEYEEPSGNLPQAYDKLATKEEEYKRLEEQYQDNTNVLQTLYASSKTNQKH